VTDRNAAELPGIRKAAILMIAVGDASAKRLLQNLVEEDVQRVSEEIASIHSVAPEVSASVLNDFHELLTTQLYLTQGGLSFATKLLTETFGKQRAEDLLAQMRRTQEAHHGDLAMLQKVDPQQLGKFLDAEHPQTVALVLAHLNPRQGSQVLDSLREEQSVAAIQRLAEMRQFSPEMAQRVAYILHQRLETVTDPHRKSYSGFKAVADLLNRVKGDAAKKILERIEESSPETAIAVRHLMFTFADLISVPAVSMREIIGQADKKKLALALKSCSEDLRAHIFKAMSGRAVEMLQEDIEIMGPVRSKDVAAAQQEILTLASKLEEDGKIVLRIEQEDTLQI
jgi:flagellar motor switch protein FliG